MRRVLLVVSLLFISSESHAEIVSFNQVPSAWVLKANVDGTVVVELSPSSCASGVLTLPANASVDTKNRFFATVAIGKTAGKKIFVWYDNATTGCELSSFGLMPE